MGTGNGAAPPYDFISLNAQLLSQGEALLFNWYPDGKIMSGEFCIGNVRGEAGKSLKVNMSTGQWHDWASSDRGGDLVSLYAARSSLSMGEAYRVLAGESVAPASAPVGRPVIDSTWTLAPVPDFAPRTIECFTHIKHGLPTDIYAYNDTAGNLLYMVARYQVSANAKAFCPWIWKADAWRPEGPPAPRPLYGLERLSDSKLAQLRVIIVEGEKCANALRAFLRQPVLTWSGGCQSVRKASWRPVERREALIWPDADEGGIKAAQEIANILRAQACRCVIVDVSGYGEGWDAADWCAAQKTLNGAALAAWLAPRTKPPTSHTSPDTIEFTPQPQYARHSTAIITKAAQVEVRDIEHLWPGVLYIGKPSLLVGDPGLGKSLVTADVAARVSKGLQWPLAGINTVGPGAVLMCSAEDDPADTLVPRLIAAGADLSQIEFFEAVSEHDPQIGQRIVSLSLDKHLPQLEQIASAKNGELKLLIVDPVSAYLGQADSHKNADIRSLLGALAKLASRYRFATLVVSHLNKGTTTQAVYRISGSLAFVAASRAAFAVVRDPDDPLRRLVLPVKNNLASDATGFSYAINVADNDAPYVAWAEDAVSDQTAEAILGTGHNAITSAVADNVREVCEWLKAELADEPRLASEMYRKSEEKNYSRRCLARARRELGVRVEVMGFQGNWHWKLPRQS